MISRQNHVTMKGSLAHPCSERPAPQVVQGTLVGVAVSVTLLETHGVSEKVMSSVFLTECGRRGDGRASAPNQVSVEK